MNAFRMIFSFFLVSLFLVGCGDDHTSGDLVFEDETPDGCSNDQQLLGLQTLFDNAPNAEINYELFAINGLAEGDGSPLGSLMTNTNLSFQLPTSSSIYDADLKIHGIFITRTQKYFAFDTDSQIGQDFAINLPVSAPVGLNGENFVIEVIDGYAQSGVHEHFQIHKFDINSGNLTQTLSIPVANRTFDNRSFFNYEWMSSATNGYDELYFLSVTNLVTVNPANQEATQVDLYPSFYIPDWDEDPALNDYVRFYGLEYSESLGLLAIKEDTNQNPSTFELVKIDPQTGAYAGLVSLSGPINSEFYSTAYRECDKTYYLTTMGEPSNPVTTDYLEIDLQNFTVSHTEELEDYFFGIELIP